MRSADATAELVELCQSEVVGSVDDHRVGVGYIEAVLDDGGGDQHLDLAAYEIGHHPLELALRHLAVCDLDA